MSQSLWNQGISVSEDTKTRGADQACLNPFEIRALVFQKKLCAPCGTYHRLNPFEIRALVFPIFITVFQDDYKGSQSLWNQGISVSEGENRPLSSKQCLNPFEIRALVFQRAGRQAYTSAGRLNPFEIRALVFPPGVAGLKLYGGVSIPLKSGH